jgi:phenylacetate-CoA ligase
VEVNEKVFSDEIRGLEALEKRIRREIESVLSVAVKVKLVEPKTITRSEGKAKRVIDNRKI